jgi:hypothetical protein
MTLHIPQTNVAAAFVEPFGVGDFSSYEHARTGKFFNVVELEGHEALKVLSACGPT